jgi:hypothetical protein
MATQVRFEQTTDALEERCSIQLSYWAIMYLERVKGIEPSPQAWEAGVLPMNYTRKVLSEKHE